MAYPKALLHITSTRAPFAIADKENNEKSNRHSREKANSSKGNNTLL